MDEATAAARVRDLVCAFQLAFDVHDWVSLADCVTDPVVVDYSGLRDEPATSTSAREYSHARRSALDHLDLQHNHTNLTVRSVPSLAVSCNFQIYRFARADDRHFHSFGRYHFAFVDTGDGLRISRIHQELLRNDGDSSLHGGVPAR